MGRKLTTYPELGSNENWDLIQAKIDKANGRHKVRTIDVMDVYNLAKSMLDGNVDTGFIYLLNPCRYDIKDNSLYK